MLEPAWHRKPLKGKPMNSQLTHLLTQQHTADLLRQADHARLAATTDAKPAKPRRASTRRHWPVLSLVTARRHA
jgi:hypothetical protein